MRKGSPGSVSAGARLGGFKNMEMSVCAPPAGSPASRVRLCTHVRRPDFVHALRPASLPFLHIILGVTAF